MDEEVIFEDWWQENYWAIDDGSEYAYTIKKFAESAWEAGRQTLCNDCHFTNAKQPTKERKVE